MFGLMFQNQTLVDAHTDALQKVIEEYDKKVAVTRSHYALFQYAEVDRISFFYAHRVFVVQ